MSNVVDLNAATLRRIIQEERHKLMLEAKKKAVKGEKMPKANVKSEASVTKHQGPPKEPSVKGGKKSSVPKQLEAAKKKHMKSMSLDEREVDADKMAETLANKVQHLKEMKSVERRLRTQLRLVLEKKNDIEQDIADLL
jgi:hypothetical protein